MTLLNDDSFQAKLTESKLVVIKFFAEWCGPCKAMAPVFAEMADVYAEDAQFAKIDADLCAQACAHFEVRSLPTILYIKNGEVVNVSRGAIPRPKLEADIRKFVEENS